jgi:hypothetical protein
VQPAIAALEAADTAFVAISAYFDGCRIKRNVSEYEFGGGVTEQSVSCAVM